VLLGEDIGAIDVAATWVQTYNVNTRPAVGIYYYATVNSGLWTEFYHPTDRGPYPQQALFRLMVVPLPRTFDNLGCTGQPNDGGAEYGDYILSNWTAGVNLQRQLSDFKPNSLDCFSNLPASPKSCAAYSSPVLTAVLDARSALAVPFVEYKLSIIRTQLAEKNRAALETRPVQERLASARSQIAVARALSIAVSKLLAPDPIRSVVRSDAAKPQESLVESADRLPDELAITDALSKRYYGDVAAFVGKQKNIFSSFRKSRAALKADPSSIPDQLDVTEWKKLMEGYSSLSQLYYEGSPAARYSAFAGDVEARLQRERSGVSDSAATDQSEIDRLVGSAMARLRVLLN
jgi:hypothetical protein